MITRKAAILMGALVLAVSGFSVTAKAQIPDDEMLKAQIPFQFTLRGKSFPAGEYTLRQTDVGGDSAYVLELVNDHGRTAPEVFETIAATAETIPQYSTIQFEKVGNKYFFSKVFVAGDDEGNEVPMTNKEKRLIRQDRNAEQYLLKVDRWNRIEKAGGNGTGE